MSRLRRAALLSALLAWLPMVGCQTVPRVETDPQSQAARGLVDLRQTRVGLRFWVPYATTRNFTGKQLYPEPAVFLQRPAALALLQVQDDLRKQRLGLKIFDGYRPYHVQQQMWDLIKDERYVSNPAKNAGRHTRGTAVDVTLVDSSGRELAMPTRYDDFTERAHRGASGISAAARANSELLERAMIRRGFIPYPFEWWHFDYGGWQKYPPLDVPFSALRDSR